MDPDTKGRAQTTRLFFPPALEDDLKRILDFDDTALGKIAELMDTDAAVGETLDVARRFSDEAGIPPYSANLVVQIARFLGRQKRQCKLNENDVVDQLVTACPDIADTLNNRREVLVALVSQKPNVDVLRKKDRLSRGIVKTLVDINGYCDVRPVFDADRQRIVDQVRVVVVRLQLEDEVGDEESVVLQLNDDSIAKLEEFLATTKRKLDSINEKYAG